MRPEHGGRVELRLVSDEQAQARYEVALFDAGTEWRAEAQIGDERALDVGAWSGPSAPPAWLEALAKTLLRGTVRQHQAEGSWPRRLTRWRPGPGSQE
ncbi:MAG TPA: hypothetical protein VM686_40120 [Polyangiaceae bacterium]|nr:hypothetical protein [Polyangiaceae bacterium]